MPSAGRSHGSALRSGKRWGMVNGWKGSIVGSTAGYGLKNGKMENYHPKSPVGKGKIDEHLHFFWWFLFEGTRADDPPGGSMDRQNCNPQISDCPPTHTYTAKVACNVKRYLIFV